VIVVEVRGGPRHVDHERQDDEDVDPHGVAESPTARDHEPDDGDDERGKRVADRAARHRLVVELGQVLPGSGEDEETDECGLQRDIDRERPRGRPDAHVRLTSRRD
jgi:hypothetical protein